MEVEADAQGYTALRSYRYERKFLVDALTPHQVRALVKRHPALFYAPYPPRYVNNLYLDSREMENYYANVDGAAERRKVRVRWYGELFGNVDRSRLEVKIKEGLLGTKRSWPLASFGLGPGFCDRRFQRCLEVSELSGAVRWELRNLQSVLLNRYYRHYYVSRDGRFRVTVDSELTFYKVDGVLGNRFAHRQVDHRATVLELKYEVDDEPGAGRVAGYFPFRMTRNSKYVQGVERVCF